MQLRVRKVLDENNFAPNGCAKALSEQKNRVLLFVYEDDLENHFYNELVRGAIDCAAANGQILLFNILRNSYTTDYFLTLLKSKRIDGVIVSSASSKESINFVKCVATYSCPLVLLDSPINECKAPVVCINNEQAAFDATNYLLNAGHIKIGHISGKTDSYTGFQRWMGYLRAMTAAGAEAYATTHTVSGNFNREGAYNATKKILSFADPPTALFVANDIMAAGVYDALSEAALIIPKDISVIGLDDTLNSKHFKPKLTTIKQPVYEMGYKGVEVALRLLDGSTPAVEGSILLPTKIAERESVKTI